MAKKVLSGLAEVKKMKSVIAAHREIISGGKAEEES
jgi:hypothetical protein